MFLEFEAFPMKAAIIQKLSLFIDCLKNIFQMLLCKLNTTQAVFFLTLLKGISTEDKLVFFKMQSGVKNCCKIKIVS